MLGKQWQSWIMDSMPWIPDSKYWILDSLSVEPGSQIPIVNRILDFFSWIPHSRAQDSSSYRQKSPDSGFLEQKVFRFPSYTVQNASENDRKTDKACEAGSWLSLLNSLLLIKSVIIRNFFLNSHFTRHGCD